MASGFAALQRGTLPTSRRATIAPGESAAAFIERTGLFTIDDQGIARLPLLVAGALLVPELPSTDQIEEAIASGRRSVDVGETRLVMSNAEVEGRKLRCLALPRSTDPATLVPRDIADQIRSLHPLDFGAVAAYVDAIGEAMAPAGAVVSRALPLAIACSDQPEYFVRLGFADVHAAFNGAALGRAVDRELEFDGRPGRAYLNGWVEIADGIAAGGMAIARAKMGDRTAPTIPPKRRLRAFPTTQLHITAGNSPVVPAVSALRAFATKGAVTVKLPSGALVAGAAFALALHVAAPDHPLTRHASIAYWAGGEEAVESVLLRQGAFERIVVWGSRASVDAVATRAAGTKTLVFNPRYGVSLIGRAALVPAMIEETARRAAQDTFVWNQQACIASLVHYVEGSGEEIDRYRDALTKELALWDVAHDHHPDRAMVGRIRAARRGELSDGTWSCNGAPVAPTSAVVRMDRGFDLSAHPQARVVVVRRVDDLAETLNLMHSGVSSVGVFTIERLEGLRDQICGRGVTSVIPLGEADTLFAGSPHDGMRPLSELVSWSVS
jgi:Acyl-CoA reductase (LuxC)